MQMQVKINTPKQLMTDRGCNVGGKVQKFIDSECIRLMSPYTPMLSGALDKSATLGTVIGSGTIKQKAPYARYQYYGRLMVDSETGSAYAQKNGKKILTSKKLQYTKSKHPQAGAFWFERFKADHKAKLLKNARKLASK